MQSSSLRMGSVLCLLAMGACTLDVGTGPLETADSLLDVTPLDTADAPLTDISTGDTPGPLQDGSSGNDTADGLVMQDGDTGAADVSENLPDVDASTWDSGPDVQDAGGDTATKDADIPGNDAEAEDTVATPPDSADGTDGQDAAGCFNGASCDDGNACTVDTCAAEGECTHDTLTCDDGNPCTQDMCDGDLGCLFINDDGAPCDDGSPCTGGDECLEGACAAGSGAELADDFEGPDGEPKGLWTGAAAGTWTTGEGALHGESDNADAALLAKVGNHAALDARVSFRIDSADVRPVVAVNSTYTNAGKVTVLGTGVSVLIGTSTAPGLELYGGTTLKETASGFQASVASWYELRLVVSEGWAWVKVWPKGEPEPATAMLVAEVGADYEGTYLALAAAIAGDVVQSVTFDDVAVSFDECALSEGPDIEVVSLQTSPEQPAVGQTVSLKAVLRNAGNQPTTTFNTHYAIDGSEVGTETFSLALSPGKFHTTGLAYKLSAPKTYDYGFSVTDLADEVNTANNLGALSFVVQPLCAPGEGTACDDGDACTADECTNGGECAHEAVTCDDGDLCTADSCNAVSGCSHVALECDDGDSCSGAESCLPLEGCQPGTPLLCDDGDACNGVESCDPVAGCLPGKELVCDDGDACTADACDPSIGCNHSALACADGDPCTTDACDPATGCTHAAIEDCVGCTTAGDCDDSNPCTDESCSGGVCTHVSNTAPCTDGNACTEGDLCSGGACVPGAEVTCDDGDLCTTDSCTVAAGCSHAAVECDDGSLCTTNSCEPAVGCTTTPVVCDDGDECTTDTCSAESGCEHAQVVCNDGDECTTDACGKTTGCTYAPVSCDDDDDLCTTDACLTGNGCTHAAVECDDGDACNGIESCLPLEGCLVGTPPNCDDGNPCTQDACDAGSGCLYLNDDGAPCDDGLLCTGGDECLGGACMAGTDAELADHFEGPGGEPAGVWTGAAAGTWTVGDGALHGESDSVDAALLAEVGSHAAVDARVSFRIDSADVQPVVAVNSTYTNAGKVAALGTGVSVLVGTSTTPGLTLYGGTTLQGTASGFEASAATWYELRLVLSGGWAWVKVWPKGEPEPSTAMLAAEVGGEYGGTYLALAANIEGDVVQAITYDDVAVSFDGCSLSEGPDIEVVRLQTSPEQLEAGQTMGLHALVRNAGNEPTTTFKTHYTIDGEAVGTENFTLALSPGEFHKTGFSCKVGAANTYDYGFSVTDLADELNTANNQGTLTFAVQWQCVPGDGTACDDGDACTADTCTTGGECAHEALTCDDGDLCTADACSVTSGCSHVDVECDDGDACTNDGCEPANGCVTIPVDCDDGDPCDGDETCDSELGCMPGTPLACDPGDACVAPETCDPVAGCLPGATTACDDGDACTLDGCDPAAGCTQAVQPEAWWVDEEFTADPLANGWWTTCPGCFDWNQAEGRVDWTVHRNASDWMVFPVDGVGNDWEMEADVTHLGAAGNCYLNVGVVTDVGTLGNHRPDGTVAEVFALGGCPDHIRALELEDLDTVYSSTTGDVCSKGCQEGCVPMNVGTTYTIKVRRVATVLRWEVWSAGSLVDAVEQDVGFAARAGEALAFGNGDTEDPSQCNGLIDNIRLRTVGTAETCAAPGADLDHDGVCTAPDCAVQATDSCPTVWNPTAENDPAMCPQVPAELAVRREVALAEPGRVDGMSTWRRTNEPVEIPLVTGLLDDSVVGYWALDGDGSDASWYGNPGDIVGTVVGAAGAVDSGTAMYFDGASEIAVNSPSFVWGTGATLMAWVKVDSTSPQYQAVAESWTSFVGGISLFFRDGTTLVAQSATVGAGAYTELTADGSAWGGQWVHLANVAGPSGHALYVNGRLVAHDPAGGFDPPAPGADFVIGSEHSYNDRHFTGAIDDVVLLNRALPPREIAAYVASRAPYGTRLVPGSQPDFDDLRVVEGPAGAEYGVPHELLGVRPHSDTPCPMGADDGTWAVRDDLCGVAAYWPLGTILADATGEYPLTAAGVVQTAPGRFGDGQGAAKFTGATGAGRVWSGPLVAGADTLTVEAWFRWDDGKQGGIFVASDTNNQYPIGLYIDDDGNAIGPLRCRATNASGTKVQTGATPTKGVWTHAACVYDGAQVRLYLNGLPAGTPVALTGLLKTGELSGSIGGPGISITGLVDEVLVHRVVKSPDYLFRRANHGLPTVRFLAHTEPAAEGGGYPYRHYALVWGSQAATPVAPVLTALDGGKHHGLLSPALGYAGWWRFDDTGTAMAVDTSTYRNHGTVAPGATWIAGASGTAMEGTATVLDAPQYAMSAGSVDWAFAPTQPIEGSTDETIFLSKEKSGYYDDWYAYFNPNGKVTFRIDSKSLGAPANLTTDGGNWDSWTFRTIGALFGEIGMSLYVDGAVQLSSSANTGGLGGAAPLTMGAAGVVLDNVRLMNRRLTPDELLHSPLSAWSLGVAVGTSDYDGDGIEYDGDASGVAGDAPCLDGETSNCDDNCPLTWNPGQDDSDHDGIGDACACKGAAGAGRSCGPVSTCLPDASCATDMVEVPAGAFWMGCNAAVDTECDSDEKPQHQVTLSAYLIDATEVTVAAYAACVQAGACTEPDTGGYCNWGAADRAEHPVNCVDWDQAGAYCAWAEKRLPTEAEWEKAARGTDGAVYPWGNGAASCTLAVYDDGSENGCGTGGTLPVGSRPAGASPYGALDMAGNVWEWVSDWFGGSYYDTSPSKNPDGPVSGSDRVIRGGGFYYGAAYLRASSRHGNSPGDPNGHFGFRCARSIE